MHFGEDGVPGLDLSKTPEDASASARQCKHRQQAVVGIGEISGEASSEGERCCRNASISESNIPILCLNCGLELLGELSIAVCKS